MRRSKYPIYVNASPGFRERLRTEGDPDWIIKDLKFLQWGKARFSAQWKMGREGERFTVEMTLGGAEPTLSAIEARLLHFLKPTPAAP